jgi:hypothetical protein
LDAIALERQVRDVKLENHQQPQESGYSSFRRAAPATGAAANNSGYQSKP